MSTKGPKPFRLERYFADYEFNVKYMLSCSDPEPVAMQELLDMADGECQNLWQNLSLGYTESLGHPLLRKEVTKLHKGMSEEEVLIIVPQEGIYLAMKALASYCKRHFEDEKTHIVAQFPAYQSLYENLRTLDCDLSFWKPRELDSGWSFSLDDLNNVIREDTRILVVNFPHNPTGYLPSNEMWDDIIKICKDRNILLFSDEMYRLTNHDGSEPYPSACSLYDNAITLFGLSKTFGLPGLRIGWLCTKNRELLENMAEFKDYLTICSSAPSEILALIALRNVQKLTGNVMTIIRANLHHLDNFFLKYTDLFSWHRPSACTVSFVGLKPRLLEIGGGSAEGVCELIRNKADVLLVPGTMFDYKDQYVRIGFGRKSLPDVLNALEIMFDEHFKK